MKEINKKLKKVFESKILVDVLYTIGIIIVVLLIFSAGISVGFYKANFGRAWGDNYEHNFGMRSAFPLGGNNFPNDHGAMGKVIKIELPTIIVQDQQDQTEKVILIKDDTKIQKARDSLISTDLELDDFIVVIGSPNNQGQIEAKFIRVIPSPNFLTNNN